MKTRRLLYLSAHRIAAYRWQAGTLTREGVFEASEAGFREFADDLAAHSGSVYTMLVNVAEESFHIDTIPLLHGADRKAILDRRLGQIYFNVGLTASQSLGAQKNRRRDEHVMLAALTNNESFAPWLESLMNAGAALSGIYSLPFLAPALLKRLQLVEDQCLLLTVQDQSLRQSYFEKSELHFSRLVPLHDNSISGIAQAFSAEAIKLQQYLAGQRLIARNQPITAHLLAHTAAVKTVQNSCISSGLIRFNLLNIEECAIKAGLKPPPPDAHCESLFLHLLASSAPPVQFAGDSLRHDYHLDRIRSGLLGLGTVVLFACLAFSAKLLVENRSIAEETRQLQSEAGTDRQRYEAIASALPPIPTTYDTLHRVIDRYLELDRTNVSPKGLYREISRALQAVPDAEIDSIDWKTGTNDTEAAVVRGTINLAANAAPRQVLAVFNRLVDGLKSRPMLRVEVLKQPFDVESDKPLKGAEMAVENDKPRSFSLQVSRKIAP